MAKPARNKFSRGDCVTVTDPDSPFYGWKFYVDEVVPAHGNKWYYQTRASKTRESYHFKEDQLEGCQP